MATIQTNKKQGQHDDMFPNVQTGQRLMAERSALQEPEEEGDPGNVQTFFLV